MIKKQSKYFWISEIAYFTTKHFRICLLLVLLLTFGTHISYINNGFVWLDHRDIEAGRAILPISRLGDAFISRLGDTGFYRPIVTLVNSIDYNFYGLSPWGFHLTNVLLHTFTTGAIPFFVSSFFNLTNWELLLIAIIFGIHPFSILPVGEISYRQEILLALFVYITIYYYNNARIKSSLRYKLFTICFLILALLSKETGLFLIPSLFLIWEIFHNNLKKDLRFYGMIILSVVAYALLRYKAVPEFWRIKTVDIPFWQGLATRIYALNKLLVRFIIPFKPSLSDATPIVNWYNPWVIVSILSVFTSVIIVIKKGLKSEFTKIFILLLVFLMPAFNIIPLPRFSSAHYGYIAVPIVAAAIVLFLGKFNPNLKKVGVVILVVWIGLMGVSTYMSGYQFKNDLILFQKEVQRDQNYLEGHFYLGGYYLTQNNLESAAKEYEYGIDPPKDIIAFRDEFLFLINLAGVKLQQNKLEEADQLYQKAQDLSGKKNLLILYNRAIIAHSRKDYQKAVELLGETIDKWQRPEPYMLYANSLYMLGREEEAKTVMKKALPYMPPGEAIPSSYQKK